MARTAEEVLRGIQADLPQGWAWARGPESISAGLLQPLADELATLKRSMEQLLEEADPRTTLALLPEWERAFGLPDPCMPLNATVEQRRRALLARIAEQGGQSRQHFINLAAALGYAITIQEFRPFRFGCRFGTPLHGEAWAHTWRVHAPLASPVPFRFGRSTFGEPLRVWDNGPLECVLRRAAPAHTVLQLAAYQDEWDFSLDVPAGASFHRASPATHFGSRGELVEVAADVPRFDYDPALTYNELPDPWFDTLTVGSLPPIGFGCTGGGSAWVQVVTDKGITDDGLPYIVIRGQTTPVNTNAISCGVGGRAANTGVPARVGDTVSGWVRAAIVAMSGISPASPLPALRLYEAADNFLTAAGVPVATNLAVGTEYSGALTRTLTNANARQAVWAVFLGPGQIGVPVDVTVKLVFPILHRGAQPVVDTVPPAVLAARSGTIPLYGRRGLRHEPPTTNYWTNPRFEGGATGTPGTAPTGLGMTSPSNGITREIIGFGTEDGIPYMDVRYHGTATATTQTAIQTADVASVAADEWTGSAYVKLLSGAVPVAYQIRIVEVASPNIIQSSNIILPGDAPTPAVPLRQCRRDISRTFTGATTHSVRFMLVFSPTVAAGAFDFTIRVGLPQLERGLRASSPMAPPVGAPGASARGAEQLVLDVPDGLYDVEVVATTLDPAGTTYAGSLAAHGGLGLPFAWPAAADAVGERHLRSLTLRKVS